jgi:uncharacterized protein YlxW (UPF0749 family)
MDNKKQVVSLNVKGISFAVITMVIGFMLSVQYQTIKNPIVRDTRDLWELREDLKKELEIQSQLLSEIRKYEEKLEKYETERRRNKELALRETLDELKKEAGLTEVTGPGIIITVQPLFSEIMEGSPVHYITPDLLQRLINELNSYGAEEISIGGHRMINTSVIRDINGVTKMDGYSLNKLPLEIKVIAKDAEKMYNLVKASSIHDDFAIDNFQLSVSEPLSKVTVSAYEKTIRIKHMKPVKAEKEGK